MSVPNFDFTQVETTQGGAILNKVDEGFLEDEAGGEAAKVKRQQAKDDRVNDDGSEVSGEKENHKNEEPVTKKASNTPRYVSMDQEDIQSSQRLSQQAAEEVDRMNVETKEAEVDETKNRRTGGGDSLGEGPASASKPTVDSDYHKSDAHSAEETISMSASAPVVPSSILSIPSSPFPKDNTPAAAQASSSSSSNSSGVAANGNGKGKATPPVFSFDSGVAEAGAFSMIDIEEGSNIWQSQSDQRLAKNLEALHANAAKNGSVHASETSTVLDTTKEETKTVEGDGDEEEDSQEDGWYNANKVAPSGTGTRKLDEYNRQVVRQNNGSLRRQNTPRIAGSEDPKDFPQVSRKQLERHTIYY